MIELRQADVLEDIKTYEDYFFDIIYSDPPYNLSSEWFEPVQINYTAPADEEEIK